MGTKLERIMEISATTPKPEFTSLYYLINIEMLKQCHKELDGNKAVGIDKVTKAEYEEHLEENLTNLVSKLKNKAYKPLPSLRVFIPKANGKKRPLGIASYEDKIVQLAVKKILEAIYEPRFLNCMYGFRPNRGCHDAIKEVHRQISNEHINHVVDADIKGFFDHLSHEWMMEFLKLYIKDPNLLWLINKYLKAGVMTDGVFEESEEGSAQGNIISPILANIYMHNVLTLWYKFVIKSNTFGNSFLVVYADDFIAGFQYKEDAERYYVLLKERLKKFNLELEESKSRMIEFGRYAETNSSSVDVNNGFNEHGTSTSSIRAFSISYATYLSTLKPARSNAIIPQDMPSNKLNTFKLLFVVIILFSVFKSLIFTRRCNAY